MPMNSLLQLPQIRFFLIVIRPLVRANNFVTDNVERRVVPRILTPNISLLLIYPQRLSVMDMVSDY